MYHIVAIPGYHSWGFKFIAVHKKISAYQINKSISQIIAQMNSDFDKKDPVVSCTFGTICSKVEFMKPFTWKICSQGKRFQK